MRGEKCESLDRVRQCGAAAGTGSVGWPCGCALAARNSELGAGDLFAPAADGTDVKGALAGDTLTLAPDCDYCRFGAICGRSTCP